MKGFILLLVISFVSLTSLHAQRLGYVDSDYILKNMPEYTSVKRQLDALAVQWQADVDAKYQEIDRLLKAYQADQVLLTPDMKRRREAEIDDKEKSAKDFQNKKFGPDGDMIQKSSMLIKPIQDKITKAIQAVAEDENLDIIFDKNSELIMLFARPRLDMSKEVLTKLGIKPAASSK
jgi:outer membrane protein